MASYSLKCVKGIPGKGNCVLVLFGFEAAFPVAGVELASVQIVDSLCSSNTIHTHKSVYISRAGCPILISLSRGVQFADSLLTAPLLNPCILSLDMPITSIS